MARPGQLLSLLSRLGARSPVPSSSRWFASKGAAPWTGRRRRDRAAGHDEDLSEEEVGDYLENVEDKLQVLVDEARKRQAAVKYHMLKRQMTPPGPPQRKLSWQAIEQIKYLKQEEPQEWTVERLAEGFSVSPDEILRVLKSKFVPTAERKAKQDAKVMSRLGQPALASGPGAGQNRLKLPGKTEAAALPSGGREAALIPAAEQTAMISAPQSQSPAPVAVLPSRLPAHSRDDATERRPTEDSYSSDRTTWEEEEEEEEESWDGQVLTEQQLEEFLEMEQPPRVVKTGKDFFDAEGNFLYRV